MRALIIVDVQNDFCEPDGALAVKGSLEIIPIINKLRAKFENTIFTLDWHPLSHCSFAKNHKDAKEFTEITCPYTHVPQMLWPVHCVQYSQGAALHPLLERSTTDIHIVKGTLEKEESYSGFGTKYNPSPLLDELERLGIKQVYIVGLATDYCVSCTAIDASIRGFEVFVVKDACRAVSPSTETTAIDKMTTSRVRIIYSQQINF